MVVVVLAGLFSSSLIQVLRQRDGEQVQMVRTARQQLSDLGRFGGFLHQVVQDQHARPLGQRKEVRHVFGQTWVKVHSQDSKVVEDGLPTRAVTVHDFSEVTGAAVFVSKIGGDIAYYAVQPGGFPAQGRSHNLHVAWDWKPRIVRSHRDDTLTHAQSLINFICSPFSANSPSFKSLWNSC